MNKSLNDYGERCKLDSFCKAVLKNEARTYLRAMKRQRDRETSFDYLSEAELDTLCTVDEYPSDYISFSANGYVLQISSEAVAAAFSGLTPHQQAILILAFVPGLADGEIGAVVGMSRSAVQRHRTKALHTLYQELNYGRNGA